MAEKNLADFGFTTEEVAKLEEHAVKPHVQSALGDGAFLGKLLKLLNAGATNAPAIVALIKTLLAAIAVFLFLLLMATPAHAGPAEKARAALAMATAIVQPPLAAKFCVCKPGDPCDCGANCVCIRTAGASEESEQVADARGRHMPATPLTATCTGPNCANGQCSTATYSTEPAAGGCASCAPAAGNSEGGQCQSQGRGHPIRRLFHRRHRGGCGG